MNEIFIITSGVIRHLYVISEDAFIADGDWYISRSRTYVSNANIEWCNKFHYKKIILTTDPKLIDAGVQKIAPDFIKWYSERFPRSKVEIKAVLINPMGREVDPTNVQQNHSNCKWEYKLIIPNGEELPREEITKPSNCFSYIESEMLLQIPRMEKLGINTTEQSFEQMVTSALVMLEHPRTYTTDEVKALLLKLAFDIRFKGTEDTIEWFNNQKTTKDENPKVG